MTTDDEQIVTATLGCGSFTTRGPTSRTLTSNPGETDEEWAARSRRFFEDFFLDSGQPAAVIGERIRETREFMDRLDMSTHPDLQETPS